MYICEAVISLRASSIASLWRAIDFSVGGDGVNAAVGSTTPAK